MKPTINTAVAPIAIVVLSRRLRGMVLRRRGCSASSFGTSTGAGSYCRRICLYLLNRVMTNKLGNISPMYRAP